MKDFLVKNISVKLCLPALIALFFSACGGKEGGPSTSLLPQSQGRANEILFVIDTALWSRNVGAALKEVFNEPLPGLPQIEPLFNTIPIGPAAFSGLFQRYNNIVIVTCFGSKSLQGEKMRGFFSEKSLASVRKDSSLFMLPQKNVFAQKQIVLNLFAETDEGLVQKIRSNKEKIQEVFIVGERANATLALREQAPGTSVMDLLKEKAALGLEIPAGYLVAKEQLGKEEGMVWLRDYDAKFDKNIFIAYRPYTDESVFNDVQAFRDSLVSKHVFANPEKPSSFMSTEPLEKAVVKSIDFKGLFAKEIRGLWMTNSVIMGGPYTGVLFVDKSKKRLIYAEGFIYAPGLKKREMIRDVEAVLWSLK